MAKGNLLTRLNKLFGRYDVGIRHKLASSNVDYRASPNMLGSDFKYIMKNVFQQQINNFGQFDRSALCADFEDMDQDIISTALDIYSQESAVFFGDGQIIHITSQNKKIEDILNSLFYDVLNIEFNLHYWIRNLCKYGDNFLLLDINPNNGIMNTIPLPPTDIEREEGYDPIDPFAVRFKWITAANKELKNWQVVHFRLMSKSRRLPYGTSKIDGARRVWRQETLLVDHMMAYRVIRSADRRVFYIDVGAIKPTEINTFMEKQISKIRRSSIVNQDTSNVEKRYNPLCITGDTKICLLNGKSKSMLELIDDFNKGIKNWTYSIDTNTLNVVPGEIVWAGKTRENAELVKITLDNNENIRITPDHKVMMRDGTYKRAKDLKKDDSLMPIKKFISSYKKGYSLNGYELIYNPANKKYQYTHRLIGNSVYEDRTGQSIHHINFNKLDNRPDNFLLMPIKEHMQYHVNNGKDQFKKIYADPVRGKQLRDKSRENIIKYNKSLKKIAAVRRSNIKRQSWKYLEIYNKSEKHNQDNVIRIAAMKKYWSVNKEEKKEKFKLKYSNEFIDFVNAFIKENNPKKPNDVVKHVNENNYILESLRKVGMGRNKNIRNKICRHFMLKMYRKLGYKNFEEYKQCMIENHKVVSVEFLKEREDTYCITVDKWYNFAVKSEIYIHNSVEEDFIIPVRGGDSGTRIETLPGGMANTQIDDVKYIHDKLVACLGIPKAYLNFDENLPSRANLSQEDVRFARSIQQIQNSVVSELSRMAIIHLYTLGYDGNELVNFNIELNSPSAIYELQKLELWRTRVEIASAIPENYKLPKKYVYKNIMNLTDSDINAFKALFIEEESDKKEIESTAGGTTAGEVSSQTPEEAKKELKASTEETLKPENVVGRIDTSMQQDLIHDMKNIEVVDNVLESKIQKYNDFTKKILKEMKADGLHRKVF